MTNACSGRGPALVLVANTRGARIVSRDAITTGSVGIQVALDLSEEYSGLAVTVVFRAGEEQADWAVIGGEPVMVPPQCLQEPGVMLYIGVYASDGDGNKVIPTVWASAGAVRQGVEPSGYDPVGPAPSWAAQVQQAAAEAVETANSVRADADAGAFDGEDGYSPTATVEQLADGATISITDKDGTTTATVHDGADGATGPEGPAGYSPSARVTQTASGATITVTDQSGTTTADISNGAPGEPGQTGPIGPTGEDGFSPTVDVQPITGGHEVTITDADGAHSFEVMDGDPAEPGSITDEMLAPDGIKPQVAQLWGNQLVGALSGTIATASDAYAAPPMALSVDGASTQAGTPTPDAPVPILSVDDLSLVLAGKNLLDAANLALLSAATYTYENNTLTVTATIANGWCYVEHRVSAVEWMQGQSVTLSTIASATSTPLFGIDFYRADDTRISYAVSTTQAITRTVPYETSYIKVHFYSRNQKAGAVGDTATYRNIQLELGSTATAYQPYQGTTVPDLLPEGTGLRSLPDGTKDTLALTYLRPSTRAGWAWYSREVVRNVHVMTLDGSEGWGADSHGCFHPMDELMPSTGSDYSQTIVCDQLKAYPRYVNLDGITGISGYRAYSQSGANWLYARVDSVGNNVTAMKAWLAEHRPTVLYKSNESPTTETLSEIELPTLPAPTATVWCDGGSAQPSFVMQYVQDTNIVIADLRAALADLATS